MSEMIIIKCPECKERYLPSLVEEKDPAVCKCGNILMENIPNVEEEEEDLFMVSYVRKKPVIKVKKDENNT